MARATKLQAMFGGDLGQLMLITYVVLGNNLVTHRFLERRHQLPVQAWSSLYAAGLFPGIRAKEIAQLFPRPQNTISRALALLEQRGLVRQEVSSEDAREKLVFVTEAGQALWAELLDANRRRQQEVFAPLTAEERRSFAALVRKLAQGPALLATQVMAARDGPGR